MKTETIRTWNDPGPASENLYRVVENIPEMLTIKETSRRTGVSYDAIRKLCLQGKIVFIRCGSKYLINFGKFCEYLNTGE